MTLQRTKQSNGVVGGKKDPLNVQFQNGINLLAPEADELSEKDNIAIGEGVRFMLDGEGEKIEKGLCLGCRQGGKEAGKKGGILCILLCTYMYIVLVYLSSALHFHWGLILHRDNDGEDK